MSGITVTVMPQIGIECLHESGRGGGCGTRRHQATGAHRGDHLSQDRNGHLGCCQRPDVDARRSADPGALFGGEFELVEHCLTALVTGDQSDVADAGVECGADRLQLVATVTGHDDGGRLVGRPVRKRAGGRVAEHVRDRDDGFAHWSAAHHLDQRRRENRLEEDLQCAPRQTRVDDHLGTRCVREDYVVLGKHAQQHRGAVTQCAQCRRPHRTLGALAADEAFDAAVGMDECRVAREGGRR